jgi:hypothetical protein
LVLSREGGQEGERRGRGGGTDKKQKNCIDECGGLLCQGLEMSLSWNFDELNGGVETFGVLVLVLGG